MGVYDDVFRELRLGGPRGASGPDDHAARPFHKPKEYSIYAGHFARAEHNREAQCDMRDSLQSLALVRNDPPSPVGAMDGFAPGDRNPPAFPAGSPNFRPFLAPASAFSAQSHRNQSDIRGISLSHRSGSKISWLRQRLYSSIAMSPSRRRAADSLNWNGPPPCGK